MRPSDIEQKTFSTALRGYDLNEVDDFLDEVVTTIRDLEDQVASAKSQKGGAAPVAAPTVDESAIGRALLAAQNTADQIVADAREEAEKIKQEARGEADTWIAERDQMKAEAEQQMAELRLRVDNVRRELAVLATVVADGLDEMDTSMNAATRLGNGVAAAGTEAEGSETDEDTADPADSVEGADDDESGIAGEASVESGVDVAVESVEEATETADAAAGEVDTESGEEALGNHVSEEVDIMVEVDDSDATVKADGRGSPTG